MLGYGILLIREMKSVEERREYHKKWRLKNKEHRAVYNKKWRALHKKELQAKAKKYEQDNKQRRLEYRKISDQAPERRFRKGQWRAQLKGWDFTLTFNEWVLEASKPCFYCGDFLKNPEEKRGFGLDRIDPNKGYVPDNVVSCCGFCNGIKMDKLTKEEAKAAIEAVISVRKATQGMRR